jgi:[NiFe] hydrogenase diaphorase moiety large subunit
MTTATSGFCAFCGPRIGDGPENIATPPASEITDEVNAIVAALASDRTRLLDILEQVQHRFGQVSKDAERAIATALRMHVVDVEETVSFYAFLNREPRGHFRIRLSKTPVSLMRGAAEVARAFEAALGILLGETSADGMFTLEWTNDIGMGDQEPAALINRVVLTELVPADVPAIVAALRKRGDDRSVFSFPIHPTEAVTLPKATVRSSLALAGPLLATERDHAAGILAALRGSPDQVIEAITKSRLRGRGGGGFPTGMKWKFTRKAPGKEHYVVCNADEGEPGTFKDRMLLTEFPDLVIDGMTVAAYALGSRHGILYLRGEYAYLWTSLQDVLTARRELGLLGKSICKRDGFDFDIRIQLGAGAYICGEESSLLNSLEGKRGSPRDRPPFPTDRGYLGQPTSIDNVETFACAARILEKGPEWFSAWGTKDSTGTKLICVSGDCEEPGVYELAFGTTVNELLDRIGAPDAAYVQMSGPSGQWVGPKDFGRRIAYEDLSTGGSTMIFGPDRDVLQTVLEFATFFVEESCGWCAPCRVGTTLLRQGMEKVVAGRTTIADLEQMQALGHTVMRMSRCGLGQSAPNPILTAMRNFPELFEAKLAPTAFTPLVTLSDALREAVAVQGREPVTEEA